MRIHRVDWHWSWLTTLVQRSCRPVPLWLFIRINRAQTAGMLLAALDLFIRINSGLCLVGNGRLRQEVSYPRQLFIRINTPKRTPPRAGFGASGA